jgi:hypothetical protein
MLHSQACDGIDFSDQYGRAMAQTSVFQKVLSECSAPPASNRCAFTERKRLGEVSDPPELRR